MVPNMVGIIILAPKAKKELQKYFSAIKQSWSSKLYTVNNIFNPNVILYFFGVLLLKWLKNFLSN
jgi:hypothetical protein